MKEIELSKPIDEMDDDDLRTTFAKVLEAHEENIAEFASLTEELEDATARAEEADETLSGAKAYFAEKASGYTRLSGEVLAARFSLDELIEMAGEADAAEFAEEEASDASAEDEEAEFSEESTEETEEEDTPLFAEKPQKSPAFSADEQDAIRAAAKARLSGMAGLSLDN
jgi:predicted nuclease with TOPRIM domain